MIGAFEQADDSRKESQVSCELHATKQQEADSCVNAGKLISSLPSLTHSGHCFPTDVTVTPFLLPAGPNMGITPNKLNCYT